MALTQAELQAITDHLGHAPSDVERRVFDVLWSEHCSYRHSRPYLKRFRQTYQYGGLGMDQNAGGVKLPSGAEVFFKIESHNHPSYIEPQEGAATGVGGILRDIFAMGARPVMVGDLLSFGLTEDDAWMRKLVAGVVKGISAYGNSIGIPCAGGDTKFDSCYQKNILVNVFALGIRDPACTISARVRDSAVEAGHKVYDIHLFGGKTGRDGIGGASMASETFTDQSGEAHVKRTKRHTVQISDPYMGKRIMEISLELAKKERIVALQDCGAAGMSGATFELCNQNKMGADIHLDAVPLRVATLTPDEILISESQERMVAIAVRTEREHIAALCQKWDVPHGIIGELKPEQKNVDVYYKGQLVTSLDPNFVCEGHQILYGHISPKKHETANGTKADPKKPADFAVRGAHPSFAEVSRNWVSGVGGARRSWVYRQYDQHVGGRTILGPNDHSVGVQMATPDIASMPVDFDEVIGIRLSSSPEWFFKAPRAGAWQMMRDAVGSLKALGLNPMGVTNGLNFASPEVPSVLDDFDDTTQGLCEAAMHYRVPVISGNVSFYNASIGAGVESYAIKPTLALGVLGVGTKTATSDGVQKHPPRMNVMTLRAPSAAAGLWPEEMNAERLSTLTADASDFEAALWKVLEGIRPVRIFFPYLKPIWFSFLDWVLSRSEMYQIQLGNVEASDVLTLGARTAWVVVDEAATIRENPAMSVEKAGTINLGDTPKFDIRGKSSPKESLNYAALKSEYENAFVKHAFQRSSIL